MEFIASLIEPLTTPAGWGQVVILMFLEIALGVDNLVFISITSGRLPREKQHIGRRLGLAAAMVMRCILLCCVVWIMSINIVVVTLPVGVVDGTTPIDVQGLVYLLGGIYLIYKGIAELVETLRDASAPAPDAAAAPDVGAGDADSQARSSDREITLPRAIATIMVMDIVFSLDSVITAAGLSGQILVMIIAVIGAVTLMIVFADWIGDFINDNPEIKVVALCFIALVGVELVLKAVHIETVAGAEISTLLYAMMLFGFLVAVLIMVEHRRRDRASGEGRASGESRASEEDGASGEGGAR